MKLEEAQICLSIQVEVKHRLGKDYEAIALQLGSEALSFLIRWRDKAEIQPYPLLPSETKGE